MWWLKKMSVFKNYTAHSRRNTNPKWVKRFLSTAKLLCASNHNGIKLESVLLFVVVFILTGFDGWMRNVCREYSFQLRYNNTTSRTHIVYINSSRPNHSQYRIKLRFAACVCIVWKRVSLFVIRAHVSISTFTFITLTKSSSLVLCLSSPLGCFSFSFKLFRHLWHEQCAWILRILEFVSLALRLWTPLSLFHFSLLSHTHPLCLHAKLIIFVVLSLSLIRCLNLKTKNNSGFCFACAFFLLP